MEPKIRLKGYTGEWQETIFKSLASIRRGLTYSPSSIVAKGVRVLRSSNINEDTFVTSNDDVFVERACVNIPVAHDGDILITAANGSPRLVGKHAIVKTNGEKVVPGGFMVLAMSNESMFLNTCMGAPWYKKFLKTGVAGGNGAIGNLNKTALAETSFYIPSDKMERDSLASYFEHLDSLIQSTTKKIESLKQVKAASLQSMFPQECETTPRVRFNGFEGEWDKVKFGDLGSVAMCKRVFKDQTSENGDIPFYKIGTFGMTPDAYITRDLYQEYKAKFSYPEKGDILISAAGTIGRCIQYNGEEAYYQDSNIVWLKHNERIDNSFLKYVYSIVKWKGLEGATIQRLYNNIILETEFYIPSLEEQKAIASYFTNLDSQISLQTQRLEKLKQIKSACLDNMFV